MMRCKPSSYSALGVHTFGKSVYLFDCTFFRLTCLTANALRRIVALDSCPLATYTPSMEITMRGILVGAIEPKKCTLNMPFFLNDSRCKRAQLRFPG